MYIDMEYRVCLSFTTPRPVCGYQKNWNCLQPRPSEVTPEWPGSQGVSYLWRFPHIFHLSPLSLRLSLGLMAVYHCLEIPFFLDNFWDEDMLQRHDGRISYHFTDRQSQYYPNMMEDSIKANISIRVLFFTNEASAVCLTRRESTVPASSKTPIKDEEKQDQVVLTSRLQRFQKRWHGLSQDACFIMWPTGTLEKERHFNMIVTTEDFFLFPSRMMCFLGQLTHPGLLYPMKKLKFVY